MVHDPSNSGITIVVPFFQRSPGLLEASVRAVLAQEGVSGFTVLVVDDGSPIRASDELAELMSANSRIRVIRQDNAGAGAARNTGLKNVPPGTRYVAFLDSDDAWSPHFLCDGLAVLDRGYDVFFANTRRFGFETTRFEWKAAEGLALVPEDHELIDEARKLYAFSGDFFEYALSRSNIISTSTLIYRFERFPQLRFNEQLLNGQDRLFKLQLCHATNRVAFSADTLAAEGEGVNIFDNARWGSPKSLQFLSNYIRLSRLLLRDLELSEHQRRLVNAQLGVLRHAFAATMLHLLSARTPFKWSLIPLTARADPATILLAPFSFLKVIKAKLLGQKDSPRTGT